MHIDFIAVSGADLIQFIYPNVFNFKNNISGAHVHVRQAQLHPSPDSTGLPSDGSSLVHKPTRWQQTAPSYDMSGAMARSPQLH